MKKEINYLYHLRIFAMLAVVMLHAITPYVFNPSYYGTTSYYANLLLNSFSRIGVPLFLMISGALILSDPLTLDIKAFYKKRLARILIPLLSWNVLYYAFFLIFDKAPFDFLTLVNGVLNNGTAYHLWYLYALFGLYLLSPFLKRIADNVTLGQMTFFYASRRLLHNLQTIYKQHRVTPLRVSFRPSC